MEEIKSKPRKWTYEKPFTLMWWIELYGLALFLQLESNSRVERKRYSKMTVYIYERIKIYYGKV